MKLETKFKVGDSIFFLQKSKIQKQTIHSIKIDISENIEITYFLKIKDGEMSYEFHFDSVNESECFKSKVELIDQLD